MIINSINHTRDIPSTHEKTISCRISIRKLPWERHMGEPECGLGVSIKTDLKEMGFEGVT
jgi:hypothetical protein